MIDHWPTCNKCGISAPHVKRQKDGSYRCTDCLGVRAAKPKSKPKSKPKRKRA